MGRTLDGRWSAPEADDGLVTTTPRTPDEQAVKAVVRSRLRAARRAMDPDTVAAAATAIAEHVLALDEVRAATTVTAYVSRGTEPGTRAIVDALRDRGVRVLLPVLLPDMDLDWAEYEGAEALGPSGVPGNASLAEPTGPRLGPAAVATADVVLAPGLAVAADGTRLGFGGGCYDRALGRVDPATPVFVLLFDGEVLDELPSQPHDRPVPTVVTPNGVRRLGGRRA
jgi:5-formyltetrahydrofolate cyclo-ligase